MLSALIFYVLVVLVFLSVLVVTVGSPFVAYRYEKTLDRILPAILVLLAGGLLIASGIIRDRDLQFGSLGHVIPQAEGSGAYRWISRIANLTVVALCVPHLLSKLMIFFSARQKLSWPVTLTLVFGVTSFLLPGLLGNKPGIDHRLMYPLLVMLVVLVASESGTETTLRLIKAVLITFFVASLLFIVIDPSRVLAPGYSGFIPGLNSRFWGLANHANAIGPMASLCIFLELYVASRLPIGRFIVIGLSVIVLALAQSKTAIGATIIGLLAILHFRSGHRGDVVRPSGTWTLHRAYTFLLLAGIAASFALLVASLTGDLDRAVSRVASSGLTTLTGRDQIWTIAYREWIRNPWFGYGTELWSYDYRRSIGIYFAFNAHNQLFQTLAESGLFGLAGLAAFVTAFTLAAFRARKATLGVSAAICSLLLVRSVTEVPLRVSAIGSGEMLMIIAMMTIWRMSRAVDESSVAQTPHAPFRTQRWALP